MKCPKCKCAEVVCKPFCDDGYQEVCAKCGNLKTHQEYGVFHFKDRKDCSEPPLFKRMTHSVKKLFKKDKKTKDDGEMPF